MIFPKITSFPQYWENGMKLAASHFQHLEHSIEDSVRDSRAACLSANAGFGLLPHSPFRLHNGQGSGSQMAQVSLSACRAILPGGYRVEILPENTQQLQIPLSQPAVDFMPKLGVRYHIFISVDPQKRSPAGAQLSQPIRYANLAPTYALECLPQENPATAHAIAPNRMKVGEWQDGKIIEGYIPPTLTIAGFPLLEKWHHFLLNQMENIVRLSLPVIQEHRNKEVDRAFFCLPIVQFIRSSQGYFRWVLPQQAPIHLAGYFANFAGLIEGLIETADRDFVRSQLQEGRAHNLQSSIYELQKPQADLIENIAIALSRTQKLLEALQATIRDLSAAKAPRRPSGDRRL